MNSNTNNDFYTTRQLPESLQHQGQEDAEVRDMDGNQNGSNKSDSSAVDYGDGVKKDLGRKFFHKVEVAVDDDDRDSSSHFEANPIEGCAQETTEMPVTLADLPTEDITFKNIFPRLDLRSLSSLSNTCLVYRDMVQEYYKIMKVINVGLHGSRIGEKSLRALLRDNYRCQRLILRDCKSALNDQILEPMLERNAQLVQVDFTNCTSLSNKSLQTLAVCCNALTRISLAGCVWASPQAVTNIGIHCEKLEVLDLNGCWNINDDCVSTIAVRCPRLTDLSLSRIYGLTDRSVTAIAIHCLAIKRLNVSDCWRITNTGLWMLLEYSKHLKVLQVEGCRSVTLDILKSFKTRGVILDCFKLRPATHNRDGPPIQV